MGYYVDVYEFEFKIKESPLNQSSRDHIDEVLQKLEWLPVERTADGLTLSEYSFKWSDEVYSDFVKLSEIAEGYAVFMGESGEMWKIEVKDGKLTEYSVERVFHESTSLDVDVLKKLMDSCYEDDKIIAMIADRNGCPAGYVIDRQNLEVRSYYGFSSFICIFGEYLKTKNPEPFKQGKIGKASKEVLKRLMDAGLKDIALVLAV